MLILFILKEKQRIEERTLQASRRARGVLEETEKIGVNTAEVLIQHQINYLINSSNPPLSKNIFQLTGAATPERTA